MELIALGLGNLPSRQAAAFAGAVCMGAGVALAYDFLRLFRLLWKGKVWGSVLDVAYWLMVTASVLGYTLELTGGEVEVYVAVAMLLGGWLYFCLLSPLVRRWEGLIAAVWENMAAFYPALAGAQGALKKILGNCEKTLPFSRKMVYNNSATWGLVPKAAGK